MVAVLPSGMVTFAFVDVVGSTSTFTDHGEAFVVALDHLHRVIADSAGAHAGVVVKTEGDGAFLAFPDADGAVRALIELQERVEAAASDPATADPRLRVRAGAHTGRATPVAGDYVALPVNVAARVTSAAGAGQALVSPTVVAALADPGLVAGVGEPVGEYALKDIRGPTALYRVAGGAEPPRAPAYRRTNVADPVTSFVGRGAELGALRDAVRAHRLVTVVGPGGMGKTRLTSELVLDIASSYDAGAWLVELASVSEPEQVLAHVASALTSSATSEQELVADVATRGPLLVLLDNCEHVIDAAARLTAELLAGAPNLAVLATSREALDVEDELVWRIPALRAEDAGCALFAHRYAASSGRVFEDLDRSTIVDLCSALDGSPLAIELASVQAIDLPVAQVLAIVREGADPLARARGRGRQSSLDAVVAWSIDRLDLAHREALLVLSQAPGRLTFDEASLLVSDLAEQHAMNPTALLRRLVRVSLVDLDGEHYRLLDTIRAAARRLLRGDDELLPRARRMLHTTAAALVDPDHDFRLVEADDPRSDRLLLLEEAVIDAWEDRTPGLGEVWITLGIAAVYLPMSERLRRAALAVLDEVPRGSEIGADDGYRVAAACQISGLDEAALIRWTPAEATRFARGVAAGSPAHVATRVTNVIVSLLLAGSHLEEAQGLAALAAELAELTGEVLHRANAAYAAGSVGAALGDWEGVIASSERAWQIAGDDYVDQFLLANNHACSLSAVGRHEQAIAVLRRALGRRPRSRERWLLTVSLAEVLLQSGARDDAANVAHQVRSELVQERATAFASSMLRYVDAVLEQVAAG